MKIVARPIETIALFCGVAPPRPLRFRFSGEDGSWVVVRVEQILETRKDRTGGCDSYLYLCQSLVQGQRRRYEIKYLVAETRWVLYKI